MILISPYTITSSELTTNIPETPPNEYHPSTPYGLGAEVSDLTNHLIYESLQAGNTGNDLTDTDWWLELGATEPWKMFDEYVGTYSSYADEIDVAIDYPEIIDSLTIQEVDATRIQIIVTDPLEGEVYNKTYELVDYSVPDYYEYFFAPYRIVRNITVLDLPPYREATVQVIISEPGGTVKCGNLIVGQQVDIGHTQYGPRVGIIDKSKKDIDGFGRAYLKQGNYSRRMVCDLWLYNEDFDRVFEELVKVRATPTAFIGDARDGGFQSLNLFGFFVDFDMTIPGPTVSVCTIEIQGFI